MPFELQTLLVRASHLANHCALDLLQRKLDVSVIFEQKWWHNALTRFTECRRGGRAVCAYPAMTKALASFEAVHSFEPVTGDNLWPFIAEAARDLLTSAKTMVARALYTQLAKFVSRIISQWELNKGRQRGITTRVPLPKKMPYAAKRFFFQEFFETKHPNRWKVPQDFPPDLQEVLRRKAADCKARHPEVAAECCFANAIKVQHLPHILRLEHELLQERRECLDGLVRERHCDERTACGIFRKGCLNGAYLLPFSSYDVKYIALTPTTLRELVNVCLDRFNDTLDAEDRRQLQTKQDEIKAEACAARARSSAARASTAPVASNIEDDGEPKRKRRKLLGVERDARKCFDLALFEWAFPGLSRIKRSKYTFANYVSTDGVGCSILFAAPKAQHSKSCGSILKEEGRDLNARHPPIESNSEDKVIGIDPGRRDMIVAYDSQSGVILKMSTRQHAHESQRSRKAHHTRKALRKTSCELPGYAPSNILR